ncbi:peptidoglycan DD-metalloendopeptidase family protein [Vibrio coralliirubri]|uniref:M23 family metallopeptidase n=1 Tax=Vibrio coralliirubri TaxID=1516159 RepID=UPI00228402F6|nr:M23 family metallopeptidase [Vibrio coralliirubri]MCY9860925.1 peptidoglycan DD-metalloendopeptidase family protein [Vibrio coralliirubri]
MNIATKACLSIGGIGTITIGYFAGVKLDGTNRYLVVEDDAHTSKDLYFSVSKVSNESYLAIEEISSAITSKSPLKTTESTSERNPDENNTSPENKILPNIEVGKPPFEPTGNVVQNDLDILNSKTSVEATVKRGDTFISLAKEAGVSTRDLTSLLYGSGLSQKHFTLKQNQKLSFEFIDSNLEQVSLYSETIDYIVLKKGSVGKFIKSVEKFPTTKILVSKKIEILNSLSVDGAQAGFTPSDIAQIETALKSKIDFSVLPSGSIVQLISEQQIGNNKVVSSDLKAVKVDSGSISTFAFYYKGQDGAGYYDEHGVSLIPSFLRHPIKDPILTSRFNLKRKHPILKVIRPHWGTDYGHIGGTPIVSISDATVKFAGDRGGFGKTVILKHPQGIETLSAHMSRFAKGLKTGSKVKKGEVVGYVGKTGLSTGYHLHFELKKNGKRVDSLKVDLPTVDKVDNISKYKQDVSSYIDMFR